MAVYEYACKSCGEVVELRMGMFDEAPSLTCDHCGSTDFRKLISAPALVKSGSSPSADAPECGACDMQSPMGPCCGGGMCGI